MSLYISLNKQRQTYEVRNALTDKHMHQILYCLIYHSKKLAIVNLNSIPFL